MAGYIKKEISEAVADKNKAFNYKQNRYTEGYTPAPERKAKVVSPDIVISNPIVVTQMITVKGVNRVQTLIPIVTTADDQLFTSATFEFAPVPGSAAYVTINGRTTFPANGSGEVATSAFYIKSASGVVRTQGTYEIGDQFYWRGSVAGIEILADDEIKLVFEVAAENGFNKIQTVTPLVTAINGDPLTNDTFSSAPVPGTSLYMTLNGRQVFPANGASEVATSAFYITDSTGLIIRTQGTYQIGDKFLWNGSVAGTQIQVDDEVKIIYET